MQPLCCVAPPRQKNLRIFNKWFPIEHQLDLFRPYKDPFKCSCGQLTISRDDLSGNNSRVTIGYHCSWPYQNSRIGIQVVRVLRRPFVKCRLGTLLDGHLMTERPTFDGSKTVPSRSILFNRFIKLFIGCPSICVALYAPVCGSNDETYSNGCLLGVAACNNPELNIVEVHKGPCGKDVDDDE